MISTVENQSLLTDFISSHPALSTLDSAGRTYLYSNATLKQYKKGEALFRIDERSDYFYYLAEGAIRLENEFGSKTKVPGDFIGGDHIFADSVYQDNAICVEDSTVVVFETDFMDMFVEDHPKILPGLMRSSSANTRREEAAETNEVTWREVFGYVATVLIPVIIFQLMGGTWVDPGITLFMCVLSATVAMWFFRLFPSYIPALFFLLTILVLGLAPPAVVLNGFATKTFIILLSTFTIGAAILLSGLGHRLMILFFSRFSTSYYKSSLALFSSGLFLTPLVPAILARAEIAAPMLLEANRVLRFRSGSKQATHLAFTLFYGISLLSNVTLSGSLFNYMILALLPEYMQLHFSWSLWLKCASVYGGITLVGYLIVSHKYAKTTENFKVDHVTLSNQLKVLGPLRKSEKNVFVAIALFIVGVLTVPFHKIDTAWISFFVMFYILFFEVIKRNEFRENIDWTFLIVIATTIGISTIIKFLGVDLFLYDAFERTLGDYHLSTIELLAMSAVFTFFVRAILPLGPAIVVSATLLIPLSLHHHIHPWVIAFTILVMSDVWFLKHQSPTYNLFKSHAKISSKLVYDEKEFLKVNNMMNLLKIIGLIASVPLWQMMGMM